MIKYITNLKKEVDARIEQIESSEDNILKRSLAGSQVLGEAFNRLKTFILIYTFKNEEEEILFFKDIKHKFWYGLIYYLKMFNI